jgi:hypothetical protein
MEDGNVRVTLRNGKIKVVEIDQIRLINSATLNAKNDELIAEFLDDGLISNGKGDRSRAVLAKGDLSLSQSIELVVDSHEISRRSESNASYGTHLC